MGDVIHVPYMESLPRDIAFDSLRQVRDYQRDHPNLRARCEVVADQIVSWLAADMDDE